MGISLGQQGGRVDYNLKSFYIDDAADLESINVQLCSAGTTAMVIKTADIYILDTEKNWNKA